MFDLTSFPPGAIALAVLAAVSGPARGDDFSSGDASVEANQTYFPAAGAVDTERNNSTSILTRIRADFAHVRGITGRGVTIGVLDTGINSSHREFAETGKLLPGYSAVYGGSDVTMYGRGLLNVEKALQPVGVLTTTTLNGRTIHVLAGSMQPSAATSMLWQLAASGQLRVVGLDDFQRDFGVDLGARVTRPAPLSIEQAMGSPQSRTEVAEQVLGNGLSVAAIREVRWSPVYGMQRRLSSFSLLAQEGDGSEISVGIGGVAPQHFGAAALQLEQGMSLMQDAALAHPYFSLVPDASHAALGRRVGGLKLRFGVLSSGLHQALAAQDGHPATMGLPEANAGLFEVSRSFGHAALSVSMSQTRESNAYLGSWSSSALSLGSRASTSALQVAGAFMIAPKLALAGQAAYGVTPGGRSSDSLVTEISTARTNAFSLALVAADRIKRGDRLSVSLSQPMRTYSGRIVMDVLSRSNGSGAARERLVFSMVPVGREMRAQLNYQAPAGYGATFGLTLMARRNPNNLADAKVETLIAVRYVKAF